VDARDNEGATPLHAAAKQGHLEIVMILLEHGADLNGACHVGTTPLWGAASTGQTHTVVYLLKQGANIDASNNENTGSYLQGYSLTK